MVFVEVQAQDFTYITAGNRTITITGYTGPGGAVSIPDAVGGLPVVMIGDYAFNGRTNMTAVTIPASVTTIGTGAFGNCSGLASVALPESVANIGWYAFSYCTGLTNITIPGSVTWVGNYALAYSTNLGSATVDSLIIGDYQFYDCSNLTRVAIGNTVKIIGAQAFARCTSLASVAIPDSVSTIKDGMNGWVLGEGAFSSCTSLTNVAIGLGVTNIGDNAFVGCTKLAAVTIPGSIGRIGLYAFVGCTSLTSISIPASVTSIVEDNSLAPYASFPFAYCSSLTAITVDPVNPVYSSLDGVLFNKDQTTLLSYPGGKAGSYAVPGTVTRVESHALRGCAGLASVVTPDSVTTLGDGVFCDCTNLASVLIGKNLTNIGSAVFAGCYGLKSIAVAPFNSSYGGIDGVLFDKSLTRLIQFPPGKVGAYTVPGGVTSVASQAFYSCTNLSRVTLGDDITNIGDFAFGYCTGLTNVTVGAGVRSIAELAFFGCAAALKGVYFQGNAPSVGPGAFDVNNSATVYYLPGTMGWGATFAGLPTALWNPQIETNDPNFGVGRNGFGFSVAGTANILLVIETSTNMPSGSWVSLQSCTLTNGLIYFSDPQWTNHPSRFYRIRSP